MQLDRNTLRQMVPTVAKYMTVYAVYPVIHGTQVVKVRSYNGLEMDKVEWVEMGRNGYHIR